MTTVVQTERLSKTYWSTRALINLTVDVPAGAVFALIGPNGAGKTTSLKTLMNIVRPSSGRATVLGVDSKRLSAAEFQKIGYVSENQEMPDWMTVSDFLSYCRNFYPGWDGAATEVLVRDYGLPLDRPLRALSRGMRMKAALASSLAYHPELIVMDEPFSGLDVLVREQLVETVLERVPEATVLVSSHDLADLESFASHVAYIDRGSLWFCEEITALSDRFREVEVTLEQPAELPRELPRRWLSTARSGVVVRFVDSAFDSGRTEAEVVRHFGAVRQVEARPMTLRSIFLALAKSRREAA